MINKKQKTTILNKKFKHSEGEKDLLQLIIDNITYLVFWKDKNLKFLGCNQSFAKAIGLKNPEDIIGKTDLEIMPNIKDSKEFEAIDKIVMETGKPVNHKMLAIGKDNEWLDVIKLPLKNPKGKTIGIIGVLRNITEEINLQERLIENGKKYRSLIEVTQTAYVILDPSFRITEANEIFERLMKCPAGKIVGENLRCLVAGEDMASFDKISEDLIRGKLVNNSEILLITYDKRPIMVSLNANMVENGDRKIICLLRDISAKKTEEARKYIKEQQQKDKLKQDILSIRNAFSKMVR